MMRPTLRLPFRSSWPRRMLRPSPIQRDGLVKVDKNASRVKVETVETSPATGYRPPATEAPELLEAYVKPKPFVSARRLQLFTVSMAVGATSVGILYLILSKSISHHLEQEQLQANGIVERNRLAALYRDGLLKDFAAPSSFDELKAKMEEQSRAFADAEDRLHNSTSVLHTETTFHLKMWWNRCLTHMQLAVDRLSRSLEQRRENAVQSTIEATLRYNNLKVVELIEVHADGRTHA